ncbi:flagellar biosynthetic protein FlhB [Paenibacillus sp. J31TS4]|uniref:flagellar biosynthesis protein FlhB n=1 Tax=Paenibacillus sp. J31TS4 TaxID=2807195 RepID=UPI001B1B688C|nr:flagellar biosynthesis protein FlhB [Paenibacillus sp. J31TS4]GIP36827.1 flagellar biosynthetic protein FlhB [Paenibacillus sp. J31TS4]
MTTYRYRLDLQLFSQDKSEPATPKKKEDARKKGQVAKSMELPGAFILLFTFVSFLLLGGFLKERMLGMFTSIFMYDLLSEVTIRNTSHLFNQLLVEGLIMLAPIFLISVLLALLGNFMQIGFLLTGDPLKMKFSKLNPVEGAKKIFGLRSLVEMLKSMFKLTVIGVIVALTLWGEKENLLGLARMPLDSTMSYVGKLIVMLGVKIGIGFVALAFFDFLYQKYEHAKQLRMSKQEIKDEYKKIEGDPLIKAKIKERQRRMAMQRMMQDIPKADVIITNPTHFAVALQYQSGQMEAPRVIAKGADFVALKIKEKAKEHGIITMENKPLARALFNRVEIGETIPADLFQAVAEVLAYVYKLKGRAN